MSQQHHHHITDWLGLRDLFMDASKRWPNFVSTLVTWPENGQKPELENVNDLMYSTATTVPNNDLHITVVYCARGDTPAQRYIAGSAGKLFEGRNFGRFSGVPRESNESAMELACTQRFKVLAEKGALGIKTMGSVFSPDTLVWRPETRWLLALYEHTSPKVLPLKPHGEYRVIDDVFLVSMEMCLWLNDVSTAHKATVAPVSARLGVCNMPANQVDQYLELRSIIQRGMHHYSKQFKSAGAYWDEQWSPEAIEKRNEHKWEWQTEGDKRLVLACMIALDNLAKNPPQFSHLKQAERTEWVLRILILQWALSDPDADTITPRLTKFQVIGWATIQQFNLADSPVDTGPDPCISPALLDEALVGVRSDLPLLIDGQDPKAPYRSADWFGCKFGIPSTRLRAARRSERLAVKNISDEGKRPLYQYSVPDAKRLWPDDGIYLPETDG